MFLIRECNITPGNNDLFKVICNKRAEDKNQRTCCNYL